MPHPKFTLTPEDDTALGDLTRAAQVEIVECYRDLKRALYAGGRKARVVELRVEYLAKHGDPPPELLALAVTLHLRSFDARAFAGPQWREVSALRSLLVWERDGR